MLEGTQASIDCVTLSPNREDIAVDPAAHESTCGTTSSTAQHQNIFSSVTVRIPSVQAIRNELICKTRTEC